MNKYNTNITPEGVIGQGEFAFGEEQSVIAHNLSYLGNDFRMVVVDGVEWFVVKYACKVLGISKYKDFIADFPRADLRSISLDSRSDNGVIQKRAMLCVNESGLYRLIVKSNKPEAEVFKDWLFGEVLPSIRKTGKYELPNIRGRSKEDRKLLTYQWKRQGVDKPVEYAMLTQEEYRLLFDDKGKRKEDMPDRDLRKLNALESVEHYLLSLREENKLKYGGCKSHLGNTATALEEIIRKDIESI